MSPQILCLQDLDQLSWLRRSENDQQHLVYLLNHAVIRMICLTTGQAWNQRWSYTNSLASCRQIFEKLWRVKFLRIEISCDWVVIEGYQTSPHNFKYGTWLSAVYAKWHWSIWYQIVSASWLSSKKNITLYLAITARPILQPKYWILHQVLGYSC